MAEKRKYVRTTTGAGIAAYAYLVKADSGRKFSDDKFKVTLVVDKDAPWVEDFRAKCLAEAKTEWPKAKPERVSLPIKDGDEIADDAADKGQDKEEFRGKYLITAKSKKRPTMVDAKRKTLPNNVIKSADEIKLNVALNPCTPSNNKTIALWLNAVQLITKNNNGFDAAGEFEDEDGYEYDGDGFDEEDEDEEDTENEEDDAEDDDDDF
ncbi:ssDNA-binding protein [Roseibium alexandrii]|uniref:DUF2815 family protein n=1 Tax=Roseibium alexandrii (strain DSM 17067 / NCIMB 14079 / DFL-11) TaxID=244592 RepID=A0A5E8GSJ7_ROSAD|nr:ssDNA-binding protein [Roseibium alexandrii]EEE42852.1 Protein of unknown function (DUF2815) [Roseibium alexandrii DFL-11]